MGTNAPLWAICGRVGTAWTEARPSRSAELCRCGRFLAHLRLKWKPAILGVKAYDRKVQKKGTSGFFVAIPSPIAYALGIEKGSIVRFWSVNGKFIAKPVSVDGLTKKDLADADKYEEAVRGIREELRAGTIGRPGGAAGDGAGSGQTGGRGGKPGNRPAAEQDHLGQEDTSPDRRRGNRPLSNAERLKRLSI